MSYNFSSSSSINFENVFNNPFIKTKINVDEKKVKFYVFKIIFCFKKAPLEYIPSNYVQMIDEMIGCRTRPWKTFEPIKLKQVCLIVCIFKFCFLKKSYNKN